jgi:hypothetical protein
MSWIRKPNLLLPIVPGDQAGIVEHRTQGPAIPCSTRGNVIGYYQPWKKPTEQRLPRLG